MLVPHKHKCMKCGKEWDCNREEMDYETQLACACQKKSYCDECFSKIASQVPDNLDGVESRLNLYKYYANGGR